MSKSGTFYADDLLNCVQQFPDVIRIDIRTSLTCLPNTLWMNAWAVAGTIERVHLPTMWHAIICLNLDALTAEPWPKYLQSGPDRRF